MHKRSRSWYNTSVIGEGSMGQFIGSFDIKNNALGGGAGLPLSARFFVICKGFNDSHRVKKGLSGVIASLGV